MRMNLTYLLLVLAAVLGVYFFFQNTRNDHISALESQELDLSLYTGSTEDCYDVEICSIDEVKVKGDEFQVTQSKGDKVIYRPIEDTVKVGSASRFFGRPRFIAKGKFEYTVLGRSNVDDYFDTEKYNDWENFPSSVNNLIMSSGLSYPKCHRSLNYGFSCQRVNFTEFSPIFIAMIILVDLVGVFATILRSRCVSICAVLYRKTRYFISSFTANSLYLVGSDAQTAFSIMCLATLNITEDLHIVLFFVNTLTFYDMFRGVIECSIPSSWVISRWLRSCRSIFGIARVHSDTAFRGFFLLARAFTSILLPRLQSMFKNTNNAFNKTMSIGEAENSRAKITTRCKTEDKRTKKIRGLGVVDRTGTQSALLSCLQFLCATSEFIDLMKNSKSAIGNEIVKLSRDLNDIEKNDVEIDTLLRKLRQGLQVDLEAYPTLDCTGIFTILLDSLSKYLREPHRSGLNRLFRHECIDICTNCTRIQRSFFVFKGAWGPFSYEAITLPCPTCTRNIERSLTYIPIFSVVSDFSSYETFVAADCFPESGRTACAIFNQNEVTSVRLRGFYCVYLYTNDIVTADPFYEKEWRNLLSHADIEDPLVFSALELRPSLHSTGTFEENKELKPIEDEVDLFLITHGIRLVRYQNSKGICTLISTYACLMQLPMWSLENIIRKGSPVSSDVSLENTLGKVWKHWKGNNDEMDFVHRFPHQVITGACATRALSLGEDLQYGSTCREVLDRMFLSQIHPDLLAQYLAVVEFKRGEFSLMELANKRPITLLILPEMEIGEVLRLTDGYRGIRCATVENTDHAIAIIIPEDRSKRMICIDNDAVTLRSSNNVDHLMGSKSEKLECSLLLFISRSVRRDVKTSVEQNPLKLEQKKSMYSWNDDPLFHPFFSSRDMSFDTTECDESSSSDSNNSNTPLENTERNVVSGESRLRSIYVTVSELTDSSSQRSVYASCQSDDSSESSASREEPSSSERTASHRTSSSTVSRSIKPSSGSTISYEDSEWSFRADHIHPQPDFHHFDLDLDVSELNTSRSLRDAVDGDDDLRIQHSDDCQITVNPSSEFSTASSESRIEDSNSEQSDRRQTTSFCTISPRGNFDQSGQDIDHDDGESEEEEEEEEEDEEEENEEEEEEENEGEKEEEDEEEEEEEEEDEEEENEEEEDEEEDEEEEEEENEGEKEEEEEEDKEKEEEEEEDEGSTDSDEEVITPLLTIHIEKRKSMASLYGECHVFENGPYLYIRSIVTRNALKLDDKGDHYCCSRRGTCRRKTTCTKSARLFKPISEEDVKSFVNAQREECIFPNVVFEGEDGFVNPPIRPTPVLWSREVEPIDGDVGTSRTRSGNIYRGKQNNTG